MSKFGQVIIKDEDSDVTMAVNADGSINTTLQIGGSDIDEDNPLAVREHSFVSTLNSTSTPLSAGGAYVGSWEEVLQFSVILVTVKANVASATDGLDVEWSHDGVTVIADDVYTIPADSGKTFSFQPVARYMRITYTNGGTIQASFVLHTQLKADYVKPSSHRVQDDIIEEDDAELVKAVLTGEDPDGHFHNVQSTHDGDLSISDNSSGLSISQGNVTGMSVVSGMGEWESGNVDAAGEDCCRWEDVGGPPRLPAPASAGEQMTVISDSASDTSAGTGIQTVRIHYLDASGVEQTEDVTMNGTTGVNTVATDMRFINNIHALTVGTSGVAVGNITIYKQGGAIATDLYNLIAEGGNMSLVPHWMVPADSTLYLQGWHAEEAQARRCALRIRSMDHKGTLIDGVFCFKDVAYLKKSATGELSLHGTPVPAFSIVKISHWDDQAGSEGSVGWWGYLKDNS